ncbi:origin recognition complex subunit 2-domain-containing protein [Radiomyces spectabilis]|uniref:origin recognition complex subunit 2-domain-containing protein n=1 Tax=Radiomyces spectabilis TaxID=64574 RepID=UPI00221EF444|nr:origin recognition complex subunit 2-domain-containing protein [Radiomyces spectabilis]KAI8388542.1 origin recognition complex subunit 2-domain-containing protein [Radiomyces spectabilis]
MLIKKQDDDEIPIHMISSVSAGTALAEEALAKKRKLRGPRQKRRTGTAIVDLGMTVDNHKHTTENDKDDTFIAQGSELATHRLITHASVGMDDDQDDDEHNKENQTQGRHMFSFATGRKKSASTMMKKAMGDTIESDQSGPASKRNAIRLTSTAAKRSQQTQTPAAAVDKRRRKERQAELLRGDQDNEEKDEEEDEEASDHEAADETAQDERVGYERYFQNLHSKSKTSNNTLSKLAVLEPQEFRDILEAAPEKHANEITALHNFHQQNFSQWYFELHSDFNLLFYGYGSKRNLLNEFARNVLTDGPIIVVNGFFPTITMKDILNKITAGVMGVSAPGQLQEHVSMICNYFKSEQRSYDRLYLIVHNVDGGNLRNEKAQSALSMLACASNIHLIASVDHINAGLLWDNVKASRFNWIWHDVTTYENYLVETSFENSLLMRTGDVGGARGIEYVLASLTSNARGVFKVLAEQQLVEMEVANMDGRGTEAVGLSYHRYYQLCREGFYTSSDLALRSQLTEFRDHQIIHSKQSQDGTEIFYIPLDKTSLCNIIERMA